MAKFRFIATDVNEFLSRRSRGIDDYYAVVNYPTYMPHVFNARLDRPTDSRQGQSFRSEIVTLSDGVAGLGFDYVFVNHNDASVQLSIDIYERATNRRMSSSNVVTAPLRRNHVTEIRGRFFTTDAQGGVGVNPGFNGELCYPYPTQEYLDKFQQYKKEMDNEENVIFAGRLAQYKYYNMDLVVKNALEIFETQIKKNH